MITPSTGFATVCDPSWYVCSPGPVAVDEIVGQRGSTDWGANFGGGLTFKLAGLKAYTEVRYLRIWGPETGSSTAQSSSARFIPVTFGIRF
jgi:hypothetical protein